MRIFSLYSVFLSVYPLAQAACADPFALDNFNASDVITKDVAIIGGGSSGTYAAISMKDKGISVVVVEKKDRIGGHVETYLDPATGIPVDLGVQIFYDIPVVRDWFGRFNISLSLSKGFFGNQEHFDFRTGAYLANVTDPGLVALKAALDVYIKAYGKYPSLNNGTFLPNPIPAEMYEPFGNFVDNYNLSALVPIFSNYNPGVGDILANPLLEVFRYWSVEFVGGLTKGFLAAQNRNTSQLYSKAQTELEKDSSVFLNSTVTDTHRGNGTEDIRLIVNTPLGRKLILAKKLVVAIPPKLDGYVEGLDLSDTEKGLFSKWIDGGYWAGVVKNTGIPDNVTAANAALNTSYNYPVLPAVLNFSPTQLNLANHKLVTFATPQNSVSDPVSVKLVEDEIFYTLDVLQKANPTKFMPSKPELVVLENHSPYNLQVTAEDIKDGFYAQLYALQGQRNTYWTGSAWITEDSSRIWRYWKEMIEPGLLAELRG